jgi:predicted deacylase
VEGLINSLLEKEAAKYLQRYCVYIMPMANKDGVARGRTRFNVVGMDLNRKWDMPPDSILAPEKHAFEKTLKQLIAQGKKPSMVIDLHNDQEGYLHVNVPRDDNKAYTANMNRFVDLLYKHTWFTEGPANVSNPGSLGEGLAKRYGIDACIYELNYEWIKGRNKVPMGEDWMLLGRQLRDVFYEYCK